MITIRTSPSFVISSTLCGALFTVGITWASSHREPKNPTDAREIETSAITIKDRDGTIRGRIGMDANGDGVSWRLFDGNGALRAVCGVDPGGGVVCTIGAGPSKGAVSLTSTSEGQAIIALGSARPTLMMTTNVAGRSWIEFRSKEGKSLGALGIPGETGMQATFMDSDGNLIFVVPKPPKKP